MNYPMMNLTMMNSMMDKVGHRPRIQVAKRNLSTVRLLQGLAVRKLAPVQMVEAMESLAMAPAETDKHIRNLFAVVGMAGMAVAAADNSFVEECTDDTGVGMWLRPHYIQCILVQTVSIHCSDAVESDCRTKEIHLNYVATGGQNVFAVKIQMEMQKPGFAEKRKKKSQNFPVNFRNSQCVTCSLGI